jgi:hypothetical protein
MKGDADLEQLEALEFPSLRWEDQEETKEERVGDQVVSMLSASSLQDDLNHHLHGPVEFQRELQRELHDQDVPLDDFQQ